MDRYLIKFDTEESVEEYLHIMDRYDGNAEIVSGASTVDGKSVLGIFSLDLTKPMELTLYDEDPATKKALEKFRVS